MTFKALQNEVCEAIRELNSRGLMPLEMGCVSAIDRDRGVVVIAPATIPFSMLTPELMSVVDLNGQGVGAPAGTPKAELMTHLFLYQEFLQVGAIANFIGPFSAPFAQAGRAIPCLGVLQARFFKGDIPVTRSLRKPEIERNYDRSIGNVIAERFSRLDASEVPGVLVAQHGAVVWGRTVAETVAHGLALEKSAELALGTLRLAPQTEAVSSLLIERHFVTKA